ncbi:CAP domain-containing protein [Parendozoicomonas haliclonae]|uniref:SCP domain-containing protein n=1 Tax=Parendozoicomonas haliclonae TaxID=1960125 RepID=A0A1X7ANC9_9GAMM|nr:CAP domain-containing protein [Parendozoicomonas haliclonae]SMA49796.1 hypothetical protein EHSB41UT_03585 [Parendozoicomonas haliclonae]
MSNPKAFIFPTGIGLCLTLCLASAFSWAQGTINHNSINQPPDITRLNFIRDKAGLPPYEHNEQLQQAAQHHARFHAIHSTETMAIDHHSEQLPDGYPYSPTLPAINDLGDRTAYYNYSSTTVGEVMTFREFYSREEIFTDSDNLSWTGLLDESLDHRNVLLSYSFDEIGGWREQSSQHDSLYMHHVYNVGEGLSRKMCDAIIHNPDLAESNQDYLIYPSLPENLKLIRYCANHENILLGQDFFIETRHKYRAPLPDFFTYPYNGQTHVSPRSKNIEPSVMAQINGHLNQVGPAISVHIHPDRNKQITVTGFNLYREQGQELIPVTTIPVTNRLTILGSEIHAWYPADLDGSPDGRNGELIPDQTYRGELHTVQDGTLHTHIFTFHTDADLSRQPRLRAQGSSLEDADIFSTPILIAEEVFNNFKGNISFGAKEIASILGLAPHQMTLSGRCTKDAMLNGRKGAGGHWFIHCEPPTSDN